MRMPIMSLCMFKEEILIRAIVKGFIVLLVAVTAILQPGVVWSQSSSENVSLTENLKSGLQKTVTLDADDAFLPSILSILAEKSGFNIVTGPGVNTRERISVHIKDTPIEEAINLVVRAAGLAYEVVGNSFLVAEQAALEQEIGLSAHVIELQYANASEIKAMLQDLSTKVQVDTSGNKLLVLASPKVIAEVNNIVKIVDVPPHQIMLEARLIEVATDDLDKYGINWEKLSKLTTIIAESPLNADGSSRAPDLNDFGGDLPFLDALPERYGFQKIEGFENVFQFSRQLEAFDITVDFLLKNNVAKVLAHTQLTTLNNREATILIGETLRWAVTSREVAIVVTDSTGIKLQITPTINSNNFITTRVQPEVSSITELVQGLYPRKKIRTASTTVLVKDGQKIFIGGLLSVEDTKTEFQMPLLAGIPLIGKLFQHQELSTKKTDLLIEITPRIVRQVSDYGDAFNLTSQGHRLLDEGQTSDINSLTPVDEQFEKVKSDVEGLKNMQQRMTTPAEERNK